MVTVSYFSLPEYYVVPSTSLPVYLTVCFNFVTRLSLPEFYVVPVYLALVCDVFPFHLSILRYCLPNSNMWCVSVYLNTLWYRST